jgi:1-acyl-sn-glycerol-3-phosphate acyltransferase
MAAAVPETQVVCAAVVGTTDITAFPKRPRVRVSFFPPAGGGLQPGEAPADFVARVIADARERAPVAVAGRKRRKALARAAGE